MAKAKMTVDDVYDIIHEMVGGGWDVKGCIRTNDGLQIKFKDKTEFTISVTQTNK